MGDFYGGMTHARPRRPPRKAEPSDVISDAPHMWRCPYKDMHGHKCDRKPIGPYWNLSLMRNAVAQHLAAQHVNDLAPMDRPDKSDERMYRTETQVNGYEGPTHR